MRVRVVVTVSVLFIVANVRQRGAGRRLDSVVLWAVANARPHAGRCVLPPHVVWCSVLTLYRRVPPC